MNALRAHSGSFRDPAGRVYQIDGRIFRTVTDGAAQDFDYVRSTGLLQDLVDNDLVVPAQVAAPDVLNPPVPGVRYVLEHPRLPFISYPYEWCFSALKAAALLHLHIHLRSLEHGVTLADASAYNVQFRGPRPVFIDWLSFRPYRDGEIWAGHRQFCEQFLNPLLLRAFLGVAHNAWYRGTQEGIGVDELNRLLPWRRKLSWNVFTHLVLQSKFQRMAVRQSAGATSKALQGARLPLPAFRRMLGRLHHWIGRLHPAGAAKTLWSGYAEKHPYSPEEAQKKKAFVAQLMEATKPKVVWDLGCNTGDYAKTALEAGAAHVVGFDVDQGAIEKAFGRARAERLAFLPLLVDVANPSPSQGWGQREREGLLDRGPADAVLALALMHHLAIGRNIPLEEVVACLVGVAPTGVMEFVPKGDPMVQQLLALREDVFPEYTEEHFLASLQARARIVRAETISQNGRKLLWFQR